MYSNEPYLVHVALHVRMGDVAIYAQKGKKRLMSLRWLPPSYFINTLKLLTNIMDRKRLRIHVFSDGSREEIDDILNVIEGSLFYLGKGGQATIEAFHCIAAADIIIGSKSGFTQVAAVVGAGGGFSLKILVRIYKLDIHT
jgi:hypothetical protein